MSLVSLFSLNLFSLLNKRISIHLPFSHHLFQFSHFSHPTKRTLKAKREEREMIKAHIPNLRCQRGCQSHEIMNLATYKGDESITSRTSCYQPKRMNHDIINKQEIQRLNGGSWVGSSFLEGKEQSKDHLITIFQTTHQLVAKFFGSTIARKLYL